MKKYMTQNTVQNLIQREKKYFENELKENTVNPKKLLKILKQLSFPGKKFIFSQYLSQSKRKFNI